MRRLAPSFQSSAASASLSAALSVLRSRGKGHDRASGEIAEKRPPLHDLP
jgi:hypothetical protein